MTTEHMTTPRSFIDFSLEERKRLIEKSTDLPDDFNDWTLEKQGEFFDAKFSAVLAAKQKREAAEDALMANLAAKAAGKQSPTPKKQPAPEPWDRGEPSPVAPKVAKQIRFPVERARDFAPPSSEDWLIKGLIPREGVGTLFGAPGEYKTFTAIHLCLHIATGETWGGRKVKHTGPVVYIAVEGARGSKKRIQGIIKAHSVSDPQIFQISKPISRPLAIINPGRSASSSHAESLSRRAIATAVGRKARPTKSVATSRRRT
jgi:AAA domain